MKQYLSLSFLLFFAWACKNDDKLDKQAENDIDAARSFIQCALNGDFEKAKNYMLQDSLNLEDLQTAIRLNQRLTPDEKKKYREASIRIHERRALNDSASIISYSNSYRQRKDSLLLVKVDDRWLVDFKYIFHHKTDSLP